MRLSKSIASLLAVGACAFAVCSAQAQITNNVTLTVTEIQQGSATPVTKGTNTVEKVATDHVVMNTAGFISELGTVTSNNFTKAAKLQLIEGNSYAQFAVRDGTNFVLIQTNVMWLWEPTGNSVISGTMSGFLQPAPIVKALAVFELDFNDVSMGGQDLQFSLRGVGGFTLTEAKPAQSGAVDLSAKFGLAGDGTVTTNSTEFVATGELSASGKGILF
jgi:hypothetical protein